MTLIQIHVALGAMLSFTAAIILYTMLGAAKENHTQFWHTTTWIAACGFLVTAGVFFCAPFYHYDPVWGEWAFDFFAISKIAFDCINFFRTIDLPPAETVEGKAELAATRREALHTLIIGLVVALVIVISYAFLQARYAATPEQTAEVIEAQGSKTRNHIDEALTPIMDELKLLRADQQADHTILVETTKRSVENQAQGKKTAIYLDRLVNKFGAWANQIEAAIERTRRTIASPAPIDTDKDKTLDTDRVKEVDRPTDKKNRRKRSAFVNSDSSSLFVHK